MKSSIKIDDLENLFDIIINKLRQEYGDTISLDNDYYWTIDEEEKYNPYVEPKEKLLGQISFDIEDLERLKNKSNILLSYGLIKIAEILKIIRKESIGQW